MKVKVCGRWRWRWSLRCRGPWAVLFSPDSSGGHVGRQGGKGSAKTGWCARSDRGTTTGWAWWAWWARAQAHAPLLGADASSYSGVCAPLYTHVAPSTAPSTAQQVTALCQPSPGPARPGRYTPLYVCTYRHQVAQESAMNGESVRTLCSSRVFSLHITRATRRAFHRRDAMKKCPVQVAGSETPTCLGCRLISFSFNGNWQLSVCD